jgi:hypothetical protein
MLAHDGKRWRTALSLTILLGACGSPDADSPAAASCGSDTLCLRAIGTQRAPLMPGRLVVVWDPVNKSQGPLEIAFDVPFSGTERALAIPFARIAPPRTRTPTMPCDPGRGQACQRFVGIAVGYVLVLADQNGNGRIDPDEIGKGSLLGAARMIVGFAEEPIAPSPDLAPAGMSRGIAAYAPIRLGSFDKWQLVPPGTLFDLVVCTRGESHCHPPVPNLT